MDQDNKIPEETSEELVNEKKKALLFDFKETLAFVWDIGKTLFLSWQSLSSSDLSHSAFLCGRSIDGTEL